MSGLGHSRRRVLGVTGAGLGATVLTGCGLFEDDPEPPKAPDPLQQLLDEAVALAAAYDRTTVTQPGLAGRLTPLGDDHRAHAAELSRVIGAPLPSASAAPSEVPSSTPPTTANVAITVLRKTEQTAQKNAATACRQAPAERVALVGSIAACRAAHVEALR